jgi:hypothetical protein
MQHQNILQHGHSAQIMFCLGGVRWAVYMPNCRHHVVCNQMHPARSQSWLWHQEAAIGHAQKLKGKGHLSLLAK